MATSDQRTSLFDLLAVTVVVREGYGPTAPVATPREGQVGFGEARQDARAVAGRVGTLDRTTRPAGAYGYRSASSSPGRRSSGVRSK